MTESSEWAEQKADAIIGGLCGRTGGEDDEIVCQLSLLREDIAEALDAAYRLGLVSWMRGACRTMGRQTP